jgi:hypothetical protein
MIRSDIRDLPIGKPLVFLDNIKYLTTSKISIKQLSKIVIALEVILERGYGEVRIPVANHKILRIDATIQDKEEEEEEESKESGN